MKRPNRDLDREGPASITKYSSPMPMGRKSRSWDGIATSTTTSDSLFQATCIAVKIVSPLRKGESVEVLRMAPEDACSADMLVVIHWQDRTMAVPLSQLAAVDPDNSTAEAIADWHYWVARGYCF